MTLESALAAGRAAFARICTDTVRITKPGVGEPSFNRTTGEWTYPDRVTVYEGPCRMQVKADINSNVVETTAGDREATYLTGQMQLPVDGSELVAADHIAEWLTSPHDDAMVGIQLNIQAPYHKSHAAYRRFRVREVVN